jgi:hypothetical protein
MEILLGTNAETWNMKYFQHFIGNFLKEFLLWKKFKITMEGIRPELFAWRVSKGIYSSTFKLFSNRFLELYL